MQTYATFDGHSFLPESPLSLPEGTKVLLEILPASKKENASFLDTALSLKLDGPENWSENFDEFLSNDQ